MTNPEQDQRPSKAPNPLPEPKKEEKKQDKKAKWPSILIAALAAIVAANVGSGLSHRTKAEAPVSVVSQQMQVAPDMVQQSLGL